MTDLVTLLQQKPESLNTTADYLQGSNVLVTGGAGDIGTELCRQILLAGPRRLVLLSLGENSLYYAYTKLTRLFPTAEIIPIQGNVANYQKLERIFQVHNLQYVFHAAANKHVPFSEINVDEAVRTNIIGTWNLLRLSLAYHVLKVIVVSTDKAVDPCNIMGATKKIVEQLVLGPSLLPATRACVRFGNVLGSRGSVLPLFQEQINQGGPVTITDPEMTRYFMTRSEAVQLVLQAGELVTKQELFILDMGEPIKILDLAKELIRLAGLQPEIDIQIKVTGIRPGEKLHEALSSDAEVLLPTTNPKISQVQGIPSPRMILAGEIAVLSSLCESGNFAAIKEWINARLI